MFSWSLRFSFPRLVYLTNRRAGWFYWYASICLRSLCSHKSVLLRNEQECLLFKYARQMEFFLINVNTYISIFHDATAPQWARASSFTKFVDHTQRHNTFGRNPLDEWSARFRDLYLTTHNAQHRQTSMPPGGIRTQNLSRQAAADLRLGPRGHWDRPSINS